MPDRAATTDVSLHPLLANRWSPRAFSDREVSEADLQRLLEAARWAPSAFNEQPWRFLVATRRELEHHEALAQVLVEGNRVWAQHAPVLALAMARQRSTGRETPNPHAWHDLGLAVAQLTVQASALGLYVHQMGGVQRQLARERLGIPEGYDVVSALAIGHLGAPEQLPEALAARERAPRTRRPLEELVFTGRWGLPRRKSEG